MIGDIIFNCITVFDNDIHGAKKKIATNIYIQLIVRILEKKNSELIHQLHLINSDKYK